MQRGARALDFVTGELADTRQRDRHPNASGANQKAASTSRSAGSRSGSASPLCREPLGL